MLKNHPKGLLAAFFTNLGERFAFYTMMAILVLFLQARYGISELEAGEYYSWFYFAVYASALLGGMLADYTGRYKTVILWGQMIMLAGYILIAMPSITLNGTLVALLIISLGNGLFKGNLQAVVGQLYDNERYAPYRDAAFMIFYMGINIGAFFAPFVATGIRNWWLELHGFVYDGSIPALAHQLVDGTLSSTNTLQELANQVSMNGEAVTDLMQFSQSYLEVFSKGYNIVFALAASAVVISLMVYILFNNTMVIQNTGREQVKQTVTIDKKPKNTNRIFFEALIALVAVTLIIQLIPGLDFTLGLAIGLFAAYVTYMFRIATKEEYPRIVALVLVFVVIIFFWMSFHQNGLTFTFFARDYTVKAVPPVTNLFFNLESVLSVIAILLGLVLMIRSKSTLRYRIIGAGLVLVFGFVSYYFVKKADPLTPISPEIFQAFNPLYIILLTPVVMLFFSFLSKKGKEPSTPRKIGIGMIIASLGFVVMLLASLKLVSPYLLDGCAVPDSSRVGPYWLMSSYLILAVAELFLSPMGISFVSRVAPPRFRGMMQSGWLLATALGNKLVFVGSALWGRIELYNLWGIFLISCVLSAIFIFSIMRKLERVTR